jgi:hypothetical protein
VAGGAEEGRVAQAAGGRVRHPGEEQVVVGHRFALEDLAAEPGQGVGHHRQAVAVLQVLGGDPPEAPAGIGEVLADVDLVGTQHRDGEAPEATSSGWVSCFGDTEAMTIGCSNATWLTQWEQ